MFLYTVFGSLEIRWKLSGERWLFLYNFPFMSLKPNNEEDDDDSAC